LFGISPNNKQRFKCKLCLKTFIWKQPHVKRYNEQHWFKLWITESYSVRQLCQQSGYGKTKIQTINRYWLDQQPKESFDYTQVKYLIYDGTYFHQDGCSMSLMNAVNQTIVSNTYAFKEGFKTAYPWFQALKARGLNPTCITMDGERSVIHAIRETWPQTLIQRCLYHIKMQGMMWLRTYPKTQAGKDLRDLLDPLCQIKSIKERNKFIKDFKHWLTYHKEFALSLSKTSVAFTDLKRTAALVKNAIPDMFHYLIDPNIPHTTNSLESYFSRLKMAYRQHRGLSHHHKLQYLTWYFYFTNQQKINNLAVLCPFSEALRHKGAGRRI
jgi:hypothetical protein